MKVEEAPDHLYGSALYPSVCVAKKGSATLMGRQTEWCSFNSLFPLSFHF